MFPTSGTCQGKCSPTGNIVLHFLINNMQLTKMEEWWLSYVFLQKGHNFQHKVYSYGLYLCSQQSYSTHITVIVHNDISQYVFANISSRRLRRVIS